MSPRSVNTQMFALHRPPPGCIELAGRCYRLARVFKHDFFAATCLYQLDDPSPSGDVLPRIVVKFCRRQPFCGLPLEWLGKFLCGHEEAIYEALSGLTGIPRWAGRLSDTACAIEYIDAKPLDHFPSAPAGFFDRLRELFHAVHARGVAYCDANKRSNILIGPGGCPFLIDYQLAVRRRDELPWPLGAVLRRLVAYLAAKDIYHLYKHKRRLCPQEMTEEELELSRRRSLLHRLHRRLTKPYRALRRRFLAGQYDSGRLVSPTENLEDHHQPEKATWRKEGTGPQ